MDLLVVELEEYTKVSLNDVTDQMRNIQFDGEIFKQEDFTTRSGMVIQTSAVYDGDNAINIKRFAKNDEEKAALSEAKIGDFCRFYGAVTYDPYSKDIVFNVEAITKLDKPKIVDNAPEKRIEFHTHTNMSEMDGVCEAVSIVKYAYNLGHEGIVITDHADVQSFVKAYNTGASLAKGNPDRPFKVGLGCEVNLAEDRLNIVYNICDLPINEAEYIAFDLETTGLSCKYDHIIEFGAVRIKNGLVTEHKQMFIKPPVSIPPFIANKTNITNDMVKDAKSFAEACDELVSWIGDAVLVAHNASFDYNFFNEELRRLGKAPLTNTTIDTLDMSRAILKERKAYRLGNIARNYHISYDEEVAHRADYDAEVLGDVFLCLIKDAEKMGARTIRDIQEVIQDDDAFTPSPTIITTSPFFFNFSIYPFFLSGVILDKTVSIPTLEAISLAISSLSPDNITTFKFISFSVRTTSTASSLISSFPIFPLVNVPVLSKTTTVALEAFSNCSPSRNNIPNSLPLPVATIVLVGIANPNAHGHATTRTSHIVNNALVKS